MTAILLSGMGVCKQAMFDHERHLLPSSYHPPPPNFLSPFSLSIISPLCPSSFLSFSQFSLLSLPLLSFPLIPSLSLYPFISSLPSTPSLPLLGQPFGHDLCQTSILELNTILNAYGVDFITRPQVISEAKVFIRLCLAYQKEVGLVTLSLCFNMYILPKKLSPAQTNKLTTIT